MNPICTLCSPRPPPHTHMRMHAQTYINTYRHTYVHMYLYTYVLYICMYILQNLNLWFSNYPTIVEINVLLDITSYSLTLPTFKCSQGISSLKVKYFLYFQQQYIFSRILFLEERISCSKYLKTEVLSYRKCSDSLLQRYMISAVQKKVTICCEKNKVHVKTLWP
jgi:hypothetical protein